MHPSAGAVAVGARPFLIAYNINLASGDVELAKRIARRIRESGGGLPKVQANGFWIAELGPCPGFDERPRLRRHAAVARVGDRPRRRRGGRCRAARVGAHRARTTGRVPGGGRPSRHRRPRNRSSAGSRLRPPTSDCATSPRCRRWNCDSRPPGQARPEGERRPVPGDRGRSERRSHARSARRRRERSRHDGRRRSRRFVAGRGGSPRGGGRRWSGLVRGADRRVLGRPHRRRRPASGGRGRARGRRISARSLRSSRRSRVRGDARV